MDLELTERFITGIGAPMAMCVGLFYMLMKVVNRQVEATKDLEKAVNANTVAVQSLLEIVRSINK